MSQPYVKDPLIWTTARTKCPLPWMMSKINDGQYTSKGAACPFCGSKGGKWAVFNKNGRYFFKCHKPGCVANEPEHGNTEIGYLILRKGYSPEEAAKEFLIMAVPDLVPDLVNPPVKKFTSEGKPEPEAPPEQLPRDGEPETVWHDIWKRIPLTLHDMTSLMKHRGFSRHTIETIGFRSNNPSNMPIMEALAEDWELDYLVEEGIYRQTDKHPAPRPSGQFFGWGPTGKKEADGNPEFALTEQVIIPYLNEQGVPFYLRPHKGGVKRPRNEWEDDILDEDGETPDQCASHVYCPYIIADLIALNNGVCILTEGEFKAIALWQCGIAAIAAPGISFIENSAFRDEVMKILQRYNVTEMVICFDNEVKDDPAFPEKYKQDPWDRWDTPIMAARAQDLFYEYFQSIKGSCRVGWIPPDLRIKGKADFDGVLAQMVDKFGLDQGTKEARKVFLQVIRDSNDKDLQREMFPDEAHRIMEIKKQRRFYVNLVQSGGDKEIKLARRFAEVNPNTKLPVDDALAKIYRSLKGCYYVRKSPVKEKLPEYGKDLVAINERIEHLKSEAKSEITMQQLRLAYALRAATWEKIKGIPEPISNFTMTCKYKIHTQAGGVDRLVRIRNCNDKGKNETALLRITPSNMARLAEFREWCYNTGRAVWKGGEKELQNLVQDMDHYSLARDIHEINFYGWHEESKLWFFGDCAFPPDGKIIHADENNIFWHGGFGYQIDSSVDERGTSFEQGAPLLLCPTGNYKPMENADVAAIFRQMGIDLLDTVGDMDAWMSMGLMAAYAAAPELLKRGGHPGLWMYGLMSGGKTTIARWFMKIWGFRDLGGVGIDDRTTHVGMSRFLAQYSCLPVWFDEYRQHNIDPQKEAVLRGSFDRNSGAKGMADHTNRTRSAKIHTTPVVTGESGTSDAATRSRFGFVQISSNRRIGDSTGRYARLQSECRHFYHIGKWLMENRATFVSELLDTLDGWMDNKKVKESIPNERIRFVYGTGYAAFQVLAEHMKFWGSGRNSGDYMEFLKKHAEDAGKDVKDETFINQFWQDVIGAVQRKVISRNYLVPRYVTVEEDGSLEPCDANAKDALHVLYIAPLAVFGSYSKDMAGMHKGTPLSMNDLRRQLEKEPYWMKLPKREGERSHRIRINGSKTSCWVINIDHVKTGDETTPYIFQYAEDLYDTLESISLESPG